MNILSNYIMNATVFHTAHKKPWNSIHLVRLSTAYPQNCWLFPLQHFPFFFFFLEKQHINSRKNIRLSPKKPKAFFSHNTYTLLIDVPHHLPSSENNISHFMFDFGGKESSVISSCHLTWCVFKSIRESWL